MIAGGGIAARLGRQRQAVEAFLSAARGGDFDALLAVRDGKIVEINVLADLERLR